MPIPLLLAPIITTLMQNGLTLLGNAVLAKGKDVIETKLGVELKDNPTEEQIFKLRELEVEHEEFLVNATLKQKEIELKEIELENANTDSARDMNSVIQSSASASRVAKNVPYFMDVLIVTGTMFLAYLLFNNAIPSENRDLANIAFGGVLSMSLTVLNFHRGSSARSQGKDDTIHQLATQGKNNESTN